MNTLINFILSSSVFIVKTIVVCTANIRVYRESIIQQGAKNNDNKSRHRGLTFYAMYTFS
jgi:hypothetical protein